MVAISSPDHAQTAKQASKSQDHQCRASAKQQWCSNVLRAAWVPKANNAASNKQTLPMGQKANDGTGRGQGHVGPHCCPGELRNLHCQSVILSVSDNQSHSIQENKQAMRTLLTSPPVAVLRSKKLMKYQVLLWMSKL